MSEFIYHAPPGKTFLPYQKKAIKYASSGRGTLIADEMGLGKTIQAIGILNTLPSDWKCLIVCPAGLVPNWENELAEWRVESAPECTIVSYNKAERIRDAFFDVVIVDEAHYCKNLSAKRTQTVLSIARKASKVIALTGTPIENRPVEIWPLLLLVCPEQWDPPTAEGIRGPQDSNNRPGQGGNFWKFAQRYCDLKKTWYPGRNGGGYAWDFTGASNLDELQKKLRATCMVRRMKKDVLSELPAKRRQIIPLPSSADDSDLLPELSELTYESALAELTAGKAAFTEYSKRRHSQALEKVASAYRHISDTLDSVQKIVVFAHHTDVISELSAMFTAEQIDFVEFTGSTPDLHRRRAVERFQNDPSCRVFLGSIGAAGVGLTLTAASHVIFVELDPVPGRMSQAEDRCHRIGQKECVLVQHLVANGSLCARIAKLLVKKQAVISEAVDFLPGVECGAV